MLALSLAVQGGCGSRKAAAPSPAKTDLQKTFEAKCRKDYHLSVITRMVGRSFWIYVPTDKPLFYLKSDTPAVWDPLKKPPKYELLYIDGAFEKKIFLFDYDVIPNRFLNGPGEGIRNEGTEDFNKIYNSLFTAVTETLLEPKIPISFIVMDITDIKKGIEVRYTFFLEDYRRVSVEGIPFDEFIKRVLQDSKGSTNFIGDQVGQHLEYNDINMADFLTKQMVNRIRFKFQQSDFPPQANAEDAIIDVIADTVRYYGFTDFKEAHVSNIRTKTTKVLTPRHLDAFGDDRPSKR